METTNYIPLSGSQAGLLVWADSSAPLGILNLAVLVDLEKNVELPLFMQAVRTTIDRLPYCRLRLHDMPDGTTTQYISEEPPVGLDSVCNYSNIPEKQMKKLLKKEAVHPFDNNLRDCQLYRAKFIIDCNGRHRFFFCVHHSIMDLYAVMHTLYYIDSVYSALKNDTELPAVGPSPENIVNKSLEFEKTEKYQELIRWWQDQFTPEPQFTSFNGVSGREFIKGKRYGKNRNSFQMRVKKIVYPIPKDLVDRVNAAAVENHMSPQSYYFLALRTFLGKVSQTEDVTIYSNASRRATLEQKRTGLTRAVGLLVRSIFSNDISFSEGLSKVDIISKDCYRHTEVANIDDGILQPQYNHPIGTKYYSVMLTYTPFINYDNLCTFKHAESFDSGIALAPVYMLIMPTDDSGDLSAIYNCASWYIKPRNIKKFHDFMLKFIDEGLNNPSKSIDQLINECL